MSQNKKDNTILLLLAAFGIYWFYFRKKENFSNPVSTQPVAPDTSSIQSQTADADYNIRYTITGMRKKIGNVPNTI